MKAIMVVPWGSGSPSFPGIEPEEIQGYTVGSYAPPPPGMPPYALVWLTATTAAIASLTAHADCLYVCDITEDGFVTEPISPQKRVAIKNKINNLGFEGAPFGLLNAAIQASQNREELAFAIATKAFFRSVDKEFMTEENVRGT